MLLLILYGYALTLDVEHVETVVLDRDRTQLSADLIDRFSRSRNLRIRSRESTLEELQKTIETGKAKLGIVVPSRFSETLLRGEKTPVQILLDGSDSNTATIIRGYVSGLLQLYNLELFQNPQYRGPVRGPLPSVELQARVWFNTDLESKNFIIPGLIAVIMMIIAALLTSLTVAREWERGTMEQLISTPLQPMELIVGKLAPYFVIGLLDVALSVLMGKFLFQVPLRGNPLLIFGASSLFLVGGLGLGFLLSVVTRSQLLASQAAMVVTFLPAFLLSGFVFAISNMPPAVQMITRIVPARYFVAVLKGIYLKGVGIGFLWTEGIFLIVFGFVIINLSRLSFKKKLA
jgi:ABC-2 type transport system permease protein